MRIAGLLAVSVLAAACSQPVGGEAEPSEPAAAAPSASSAVPPATSPTSQNTAAAPAAGASMASVVTWIEAGAAADPGDYHVAFRDGVTTRLGEKIAFIAPSGPPHSTTQCITGAQPGSLTCLLDLSSPPPRPAQAEGMWQPGWIEFSGTELSVGSLRGDPGPFTSGTGAELTPGQSLTFGESRCRSDSSGLYCVNYAHRSAIRIAADGVVAYGCLAEVQPPPESTTLFRC